MNLRKQVEPLLSVSLQASSQQRHAQHAAPRLAWVVTSAQDEPPKYHHEQSRSVCDLSASGRNRRDESVRVANEGRAVQRLFCV